MAEDVGLYSGKLDQNIALHMAVLCDQAYEPRGEGKDNGPDPDLILANLQEHDARYQSVVGTSQNSAQAIFVEHADFYCMAFRGTDEWEDWLDNLDGRKVASDDAMFGEFHSGFYNSCMDVWHVLNDAYLAARARQRKPLFLTGHSLGGAMATVAAARFINDDRPFAAVYTFGQPRAVKRATARAFNAERGKRFYRFQNNQDIVTRVPARFMNYSHVGECLYIDGDGDIHRDPGFWAKFLDFVDGAVDSLRQRLEETRDTEGLINDHVIHRYLERVRDWKLQD